MTDQRGRTGLFSGRMRRYRALKRDDSFVFLAPGLAVHRREGEWRLLVHGDERPQGFHTPEAAIEYAQAARYAR